jgi:TRAP-type C4-dicarboxylate transport system permease small subunit
MRRFNEKMVLVGAFVFGFITLIGTYAIISRDAFNKDIDWTEAALIIGVILVAFWGAADRLSAKRHITIEFLHDHLKGNPQHWLDVIIDASGLLACGVTSYYCITYTIFLFHNGTKYISAFEIPVWTVTAAIAFGLIMLSVTFGEQLFKDIRLLILHPPEDVKKSDGSEIIL